MKITISALCAVVLLAMFWVITKADEDEHCFFETYRHVVAAPVSQNDKETCAPARKWWGAKIDGMCDRGTIRICVTKPNGNPREFSDRLIEDLKNPKLPDVKKMADEIMIDLAKEDAENKAAAEKILEEKKKTSK